MAKRPRPKPPKRRSGGGAPKPQRAARTRGPVRTRRHEPGTPRGTQHTAATGPRSRTGIPRLVLKRNQDRRLRGGHPWIFSNEVDHHEGEVQDGDLVEVTDNRGAFLARAYYNRHSLICARVIARRRDDLDVEFFVKRLQRAIELRERVLPGESAVRLVHGESDQLPGLVIDRYGDVLAVQILTLGMEKRADVIRQAIEQVLAPSGVARIADSSLRELEGLPLAREVWWGEVPDTIEVEVEGFRVEADVLNGQKTGLFLDQRLNRRRAEAHAQGKKVLDLFAYQGEWSLHAARGGAASVLGVDSSESAIAAAERNAGRNGLSEMIRFQRGDCFEVLRDLERSRKRFGLVILDPPALIKSRKHLAAGARAYREFNRLAMNLLEPQGTLISCSCSHHLEDLLFRQVLLEAARAARRPFRVFDWAAESPDHPQLLAVPETHYLKCAVLEAV